MRLLNDFFQVRKHQWKEANAADRMRILFIDLLQISFVVALVLAFIEREWLTLFICVLAIGVIWIPPILAKNYQLRFPLEFEFLLAVFIYASIFLGEFRGYYTRFEWWDIVLHTGSGMALGFIGFIILFSLYRSGRLQTSPSLIALFSFSFSVALGALWEIFEFSMDSIFGFNMQKSGLVDTMWDMIVNAGGAFIVSLSGYLYMKKHSRGIGFFQYYLNTYFLNKKTDN